MTMELIKKLRLVCILLQLFSIKLTIKIKCNLLQTEYFSSNNMDKFYCARSSASIMRNITYCTVLYVVYLHLSTTAVIIP
jgi:hypothetical protein